MGTTVAFLADCQGAATIDDQKACLAHDDYAIVAARHGFNRLEDILSQHGIRLGEGDRVKVYDLSCITLSTTTLVREICKLLQSGVAFEIVSAGIVIAPSADDKLHALLQALDTHNRYVHGLKTHPSGTVSRGRRRLLDADKLPEIRAKLDRPGVSATQVAKELGVARSTLFNFLERYDVERLGRGKKGVERSSEHSGNTTHIGKADTDKTAS